LGGLTGDAGTWTLPRLTATHELMGTPCYAAPEQLRGEPPTTRSDLYSWGLTLLECLTGEVAVSGRSAHEVIYKQLGPDPVPIPAQLREHRLGRILEVVTAKPVEKREATARLEADRGLRLDVRAGIHTGLVVARELRHAGRLELSDLVGLTPQLAIRVEERAAPGEVLASAASVRLARGDIDAEPAGSLADRTGGVELPVYRLQRDQRFGRERQTIPWVQETPLVGRSGEVRQVVGPWQQVEGGTSRVVLVKGEPGIGKSRLVRELRRRIPSE